MYRYSVNEKIGENGITLQNGQKVYDAIYPQLKDRNTVVLDFANVRIVASPFLNAAVGQLLRDISPDDLNRHLKFENLSAPTRPILKRVIENAKEFYGMDNAEQSERIRMAITKVLKEELGSIDE